MLEAKAMWERECRYDTNILYRHNMFYLGAAIFRVMRALCMKFHLC